MENKTGRIVKEFDYIEGHFIYKKDKRVDFDFYLSSKKEVSFLQYILKSENIESGIICLTDSPLGKAILGKMSTTTFIVEDAKFYIDKIESLKEIIQKKEEEKTR